MEGGWWSVKWPKTIVHYVHHEYEPLGTTNVDIVADSIKNNTNKPPYPALRLRSSTVPSSNTTSHPLRLIVDATLNITMSKPLTIPCTPQHTIVAARRADTHWTHSKCDWKIPWPSLWRLWRGKSMLTRFVPYLCTATHHAGSTTLWCGVQAYNVMAHERGQQIDSR